MSRVTCTTVTTIFLQRGLGHAGGRLLSPWCPYAYTLFMVTACCPHACTLFMVTACCPHAYTLFMVTACFPMHTHFMVTACCPYACTLFMVTACCPHACTLFMVTACCPHAFIHFVPGDKAVRLPSWCQDEGYVELQLTLSYSFMVLRLNTDNLPSLFFSRVWK